MSQLLSLSWNAFAGLYQRLESVHTSTGMHINRNRLGHQYLYKDVNGARRLVDFDPQRGNNSVNAGPCRRINMHKSAIGEPDADLEPGVGRYIEKLPGNLLDAL